MMYVNFDVLKMLNNGAHKMKFFIGKPLLHKGM